MPKKSNKSVQWLPVTMTKVPHTSGVVSMFRVFRCTCERESC